MLYVNYQSSDIGQVLIDYCFLTSKVLINSIICKAKIAANEDFALAETFFALAESFSASTGHLVNGIST